MVQKSQSSSPRKSKPKKWIVSLGVVAVVLFAASIGFGLWHEQPSFCNAVCHKPMDEYVNNYQAGNGLARIHKESGVTCVQCHKARIDEQATEAVKWVTGDFDEKLDIIDFDSSQCTDCHNEQDVQQKTAHLKRNPHTDAHQKMKCTDCHRSHRPQVDYCASCHDNGGQTMLTYTAP